MKRVINNVTVDEHGVTIYKMMRVCACNNNEVLCVAVAVSPIDKQRRYATAQMLKQTRAELREEMRLHQQRGETR